MSKINQTYIEFVLDYAKTEGLYGIIRELKLNKEKDSLKADLQPDLIQKFSIQFSDTNLKELDDTVEWILINAAIKMKNGDENDSTKPH